MIRLRQLWVVHYASVRYWVLVRVLRPYKFTSGFENQVAFDRHFLKHRNEHSSFRWAFTYARFADLFCGGSIDANTLEHVRRHDGATVRCNPQTRIVGVLHANGFIGTCHVHGKAMNWFQQEQTR